MQSLHLTISLDFSGLPLSLVCSWFLLWCLLRFVLSVNWEEQIFFWLDKFFFRRRSESFHQYQFDVRIWKTLKVPGTLSQNGAVFPANRFSSSKNEIVICQKKNLSNTTIEAIILWIGATVSLMLQCVSWENCHSSLQWVGWLNSETLRIIIEQSNWVAVRCHCNTFWQFMIILQVFKKPFLKALFIQNNILIRCHALRNTHEIWIKTNNYWIFNKISKL